MKSLKIKDFTKGEYCDYEVMVDLWNNKNIYCSIKVPGNDNLNKLLEEYIFYINSRLTWIENNKKVIEDALIEDGMLELAEEWIEGADYFIVNDEEIYEIDSDVPVKLPLLEKDFRNSIGIESFGIDVIENEDEEEYKTEVSMYLECNPDYFAGHVIEVIVDSHNQIKVNGLAG